MQQATPQLEVNKLSRAFGKVQAVRDVSFRVSPGEIVALLGANGAGKSTLLAMLAGFDKPDTGEMFVAGKAAVWSSPADAIRAGIGMVHQHLSLVPTFTVREQLALAGHRGASLPTMLESTVTGLERIAALSMGQRQRVEIAKALIRQPRVVLLDEPTSILAPSEVEGLFAALRDIASSGTAVVLVTHKLKEARSVADRVLVMRDGALVLDRVRPGEKWDSESETDVLNAMFGDIPSTLEPELQCVSTMDAVPVLRLVDERVEESADHDFTVMPGEVVTITGIDGNGQHQLAEHIAGYQPARGRVVFNGRDVTTWAAEQRAAAGMGLLVDDRLGEASVPSMTVTENVGLKRPRMGGAVTARARAIVDSWGIIPANIDARLGSLSGGNIQRILLGRELDRGPKLLIALNPVHGLDPKSSAMVWSRLAERCAQGAGGLVFTTDLDEAMRHGHRVGVIRAGRVSPLVLTSEVVRLDLASWMVDGW